ncbi:MAG TPA: hypothetical protein VGU20_23655 [Stellaceae bacterium]|nr:hypothetical protein [Stellaceae bacterium]
MALFDLWVKAPIPMEIAPYRRIGFGGKKNIDKPSRVKAFCEKLFASRCPYIAHRPWCLAYQSGRLL